MDVDLLFHKKKKKILRFWHCGFLLVETRKGSHLKLTIIVFIFLHFVKTKRLEF